MVGSGRYEYSVAIDKVDGKVKWLVLKRWVPPSGRTERWETLAQCVTNIVAKSMVEALEKADKFDKVSRLLDQGYENKFG